MREYDRRKSIVPTKRAWNTMLATGSYGNGMR